MTHKILITGALHPVALEILRAAGDVAVEYRPDLPRDEIVLLIGDCAALVTRSETAVDLAPLRRRLQEVQARVEAEAELAQLSKRTPR